MTYDIGDRVVLQGAFTSRALSKREQSTLREDGTLPAGVGVDPAEVVCTVRSPSGTVTTPLVAGADGVYTAELSPTEEGVWRYAFDGEGDHQASGEQRFSVRERQIAR